MNNGLSKYCNIPPKSINQEQPGYHKGSHNIRVNEAKAYKSKANLSNLLFMMQQVNQGHFLF